MNSRTLDPLLQAELEEIYKQVMWLARRPGVTAGNARAWYTHIMSEKFKRRIRQFSGKVSQAAASSKDAGPRLEHYRRMQTTLTKLVERHRRLNQSRPEEFVSTILKCERVHIVTNKENDAVMREDGNYRKARIALIKWQDVPPKRRRELWRKMLSGKVANAKDYAPEA